MSRKPFIAGNWKMHKTIAETADFINALKTKEWNGDRDVLICPSFIALSESAKLVEGSKISLGSQNMHFEEQGAFTGEISPLMLKGICEYVILGHSERRHVFGEDDSLINSKVKSALEHGFKPILCVGEKIEQRKEGKMEEVIRNQLLKGLEGVDNLSNVIIAYEPVWAIGTGETATPEQAEEVHVLIRSLIDKKYGDATDLRILYGGSVKPENVNELMSKEDIDGVLVGGASLDVEKFLKLINFEN